MGLPSNDPAMAPARARAIRLTRSVYTRCRVAFAFCICLSFSYYAQYCEPTVLQFVRVFSTSRVLYRVLFVTPTQPGHCCSLIALLAGTAPAVFIALRRRGASGVVLPRRPRWRWRCDCPLPMGRVAA